MKGIYADASGGLAEVFARVYRSDDPPVTVYEHETILPEQFADLYSGHDFMLNDHTNLPTEAMAQIRGLKHVIFLGTGARSYMDVEAIEHLGIRVHTIRGYGDTAVGEHTIALMWAAARNIAWLDRSMRGGRLAARQCDATDRQDAGDCSASAASPARSRASRSAAACACSPGTARRAASLASNSSTCRRCWQKAMCCRSICC